MAEKNLPVTADVQAGEFLKKFGKSLEEYAVRKYDNSAFLKGAMIAIIENDTLKEALKTDAGKLSLFNALRYASTTGLSLNPQEGKAALVAYKKNNAMVINYQVMKNGMVELAQESGKIEVITADYVRDNDEFKIEKTSHGDSYTFIPAIKDRGDLIGFFAALKLKTGITYVKWMTKDEVEYVRDNYSSMYKFNKENSPWMKSFLGMGVKTVLKALLRNVFISADLDTAIGTDDFFEADFTETPGVSADEVAEKMKDKKEEQSPEQEQKAESKSDQGSLL